MIAKGSPHPGVVLVSLGPEPQDHRLNAVVVRTHLPCTPHDFIHGHFAGSCEYELHRLGSLIALLHTDGRVLGFASVYYIVQRGLLQRGISQQVPAPDGQIVKVLLNILSGSLGVGDGVVQFCLNAVGFQLSFVVYVLGGERPVGGAAAQFHLGQGNPNSTRTVEPCDDTHPLATRLAERHLEPLPVCRQGYRLREIAHVTTHTDGEARTGGGGLRIETHGHALALSDDVPSFPNEVVCASFRPDFRCGDLQRPLTFAQGGSVDGCSVTSSSVGIGCRDGYKPGVFQQIPPANHQVVNLARHHADAVINPLLLPVEVILRRLNRILLGVLNRLLDRLARRERHLVGNHADGGGRQQHPDVRVRQAVRADVLQQTDGRRTLADGIQHDGTRLTGVRPVSQLDKLVADGRGGACGARRSGTVVVGLRQLHPVVAHRRDETPVVRVPRRPVVGLTARLRPDGEAVRHGRAVLPRLEVHAPRRRLVLHTDDLARRAGQHQRAAHVPHLADEQLQERRHAAHQQVVHLQPGAALARGESEARTHVAGGVVLRADVAGDEANGGQQVTQRQAAQLTVALLIDASARPSGGERAGLQPVKELQEVRHAVGAVLAQEGG